MPSDLRCLWVVLVVVLKTVDNSFIITRGDQDTFTNSLAVGHITGLQEDCKHSKAKCANNYNCQDCRCPPSHPTYIRKRGDFGECVENNMLVYIGCKYECI